MRGGKGPQKTGKWGAETQIVPYAQSYTDRHGVEHKITKEWLQELVKGTAEILGNAMLGQPATIVRDEDDEVVEDRRAKARARWQRHRKIKE